MAPGSLCPVSLSTESRVSPPGGGYGVWRCLSSAKYSLNQVLLPSEPDFSLSLSPIKCPQNLILQTRCVVTDIACQVVTSAPSLVITCDGSGRTFVQTRPTHCIGTFLARLIVSLRKLHIHELSKN